MDIVERALVARLGQVARRPFVLGICGAQGSGKSTLAEQLERRLIAAGLRAAVLSLDDFYLAHEVREQLAKTVHPLLQTRGVPGTHDVALGLSTLASLRRGEITPLPRFDKTSDTRRPIADWPQVEGRLDVLLFEGWCVGALPQSEEELVAPINDLERTQDADRRWRRNVNAALGGEYQQLFGHIDMQLLLAAPTFEIVAAWRSEQEHELKRQLVVKGLPNARIMSDAEVTQFVQFYERLTRHILNEMPGRADLVLSLDVDRRVALTP